MALALTYPLGMYGTAGRRRSREGTGNLGVYATGGISWEEKDWHLSWVTGLKVHPVSGYNFETDPLSGKKILARRETNDGTGGVTFQEVPNGIDLSAVVFRWEAEGY